MNAAFKNLQVRRSIAIVLGLLCSLPAVAHDHDYDQGRHFGYYPRHYHHGRHRHYHPPVVPVYPLPAPYYAPPAPVYLTPPPRFAPPSPHLVIGVPPVWLEFPIHGRH